MNEGALVPAFDWYQASVPIEPEALVREVHAAMPEGIQRLSGKGFNSFRHRVDLADSDGEVYACVQFGGVNPHPNVKSTGSHAPFLAQFLRHDFPDHRVSRLDVCLDYQGDGAFDDTIRIMTSVGKECRLRGERIIPDDLDDGSTYYLGAPSSALRVRCYEKGKQLFRETRDPVWKQFFDWTRLELQVRPQKKFKAEAALMEPAEFWGCAYWTRQIAAGALGMNAEPVQMKPSRIADHERAMCALTSQYGPTILRQIEKLGSWEAFCADLKCRLGIDLAEVA